MLRKLVFAAVGSAAMLTAGAAFAASSSSPPEPYSAPDPVYTPHQIQDAVTMENGHVTSQQAYPLKADSKADSK